MLNNRPKCQTCGPRLKQEDSISRVYLPWLGEFGSMISYYVRAVYADNNPKIVCHEKGLDCLFPKAEFHYVFDRIPIRDRGDAGARNQGERNQKIMDELGPNHEYIISQRTMSLPKKSFIPQPLNRYEIKTDLVIFARNLKRTNWRTWSYWPQVFQALKDTGISIFNAGEADSSYHFDCPSSWDFENPLEATIIAINNSKIRLGTGTGTLMLSVFCGKQPTVILTENGCVDLKDKMSFAIKQHQSVDQLGVGWRTLPYLKDWQKVVESIKHDFKL